MRLVLAGSLVALAVVGAGEAGAASLADRCPAYAAEMERARVLLARDDRAGALLALRAARTALDACVDHAPEPDGVPVMLVAVPRPRGGS